MKKLSTSKRLLRQKIGANVLTIIERKLDVINGHEHTQVEAIRGLAPKGTSIQVLTHRAFGLPIKYESAAIIPALCDRKSVRENEHSSLAADVGAVQSYLRTTEAQTDSVLVPSAYAYEIRLCLRLIEALPNARCALRILRPEPINDLTPEELEQLRGAISGGQLSLHTELSELSERLTHHYLLPASSDFLLPSTIDPSTSVDPMPVQSASDQFRLGNLGNYRSEKGSDRMPEIIRALVKELRQCGGGMRIDLVLQIPGSIRKTPRKLLYILWCHQAILRQGFRRNLRLKWYKGGLSSEQFFNMMVSMDVVLVPYITEAYRFRGSGVIVDAVLAGRAIVYSEGIGMQRYVSHGNARSAADPAEFAREIVELLGNGENRSRAVEAAKIDVLKQLDRTREFLASLA